MWMILAINALFLWWIIAGVGSNADNCAGKVGQALQDCHAGTPSDRALQSCSSSFVWAIVDIILSGNLSRDPTP
jgi:hypothetical protein